MEPCKYQETIILTQSAVKNLETKIDGLIEKFDCFTEKCDKLYLRKDEYDPIRKVVYGMVSIILFAFVTGIIALLIK